MKKIDSIQDYRELFDGLRQLRKLRILRKDKIHSNIKRRYGRKRLEKFVEKFWKGGYVHLETGDYLYIPPVKEIGHSLRLIHPYIPEQIIPKFCKPGSVVMDIGANVGEWTLNMAKMVGDTGKVFSIEPVPFMVKALKKTVAINNLSQVSIFQGAISNKIGSSPLTIPYTKDNLALSFGSQLGDEYKPPPKDVVVSWEAMETSKTIEVQTTDIDSFCSEKNIQRLDFIKVDVEGHEKYVIEGGSQTFKTLKPALFLEVGAEKIEDRQIIADQLRKLNYEIVGVILQDGVIEVNWPQYINLHEPFESSYFVNVLFLPRFF
tara:strand:+ start:1200 stop:2156 length:957 start_codon:yes stop_codon:yes gene_type:complete